MNNRIYLIGFMASGKTTVGKKLAKELGFQFADTDLWIEEKTGLKISQIFTLYGETYFRKLEKEAVSHLSKENSMVISTGGGLPCFYNNIKIMKKTGKLFFLKCGFESSVKRMKKNKSRPLSTILSKEQLKQLYNERQTFYNMADFTVLSNREIPLVVKRIITLMNNKK